jgi:hypothetical protein
MSPTIRPRNPVIHRAWLILAVRTLGTLASTVSRRPRPGPAIPATTPAVNWLRPVLAGCIQPAGGPAALPTSAHHVIMTPGPLPGGCVTMAWGRRARPGRRVRPGRHPARIDSPAARTTSSSPSLQRLQRHMVRGMIDGPIVPSPSLGLFSCQLTSSRGRHLRMVALSG